jgi:6-pyruvoyltetrahydropterin/6-carboxytetrahydropterin synthase
VERLGADADFIIAPDVVADGDQTARLAREWLPRLDGFRRVLLAVQDGMSHELVEELLDGRPNRGIFLGGSDAWKDANIVPWGWWCGERNIYYHVGRVNTRARMRWCLDSGADSVDGTSGTRFGDNVPRVDRWRNEPNLLAKVDRTMKISRTYTFQAAHRLPNVPADHKCSRLHGHTYEVEIEVSGPVDPTMGWVRDFGMLDAAWDAIAGKMLDHRYLNEIEGLENPTSEHLTVWLWRRLSTHLWGEVVLSRLVVRENGRSAAICEPGDVESLPGIEPGFQTDVQYSSTKNIKHLPRFQERVTGIEPATFSLGSTPPSAEGAESVGNTGDSERGEAARSDVK